MMQRRGVLAGFCWLGVAPAWSAPMTEIIQNYQTSLPPNYGPGAVFAVKASAQAKGIRLTGRVLRSQDKQALTAAFAAQKIGPVDNQVQVFPYPALGARSYGVVTAPVVDLRAEANTTSELVSQAVQGDGVLLLGQQRDWYEIFRQWDGYVGWLPQTALQTMTLKEFQQVQQQPRYLLLEDQALGRAGAILSQSVPQAQTRLLVEPTTAKQVRTRVVAYAQALYTKSRTTPFSYLWGGTYGTGLDCSGFNQTVYRLAGLAIPRDSYQQQGFGTPLAVTPDRLMGLEPGDLVFFNEKKATRQRATHTGIYVGNGQVIHSSGGRGNKGLGINNLQGDLPYEDFLRSIWWGAARLIPQTLTTTSQGLFI